MTALLLFDFGLFISKPLFQLFTAFEKGEFFGFTYTSPVV